MGPLGPSLLVFDNAFLGGVRDRESYCRVQDQD